MPKSKKHLKSQPEIILASGSAQRKNLMKLLDIPFEIKPSQAEEIQEIQTTCSALVKKNAWLKANDIAQKLSSGCVIGSDTVVFSGTKKLILKPKTLAEAKKNLKLLMSQPAWIYTGVALIDAATGKKLVDFEKTKVFMSPMSDKEIDAYHKKVPPFDKAGGFDIEGLGSTFIHRIEGCYTNVIGLPMAKLKVMLKTMGVSILSVVMMAMISGCSSEYNLATQKQETLLHSSDREVRIGEKVAVKIEKRYDVVTDVDVNERVQEMLDRIVAVSDRKDILYFIKVLDKDIINAISLPGGYIYIFTGLIDKVKNDDQLAGVIAHEVGHITARHGVKRMQASYGALALQLASLEAGGRVAAGVNLAITSLFMEHSQDAEHESDKLAVRYMQEAGYDPVEMRTFLEILKKEHEDSRLRNFSYWKTHPHPTERIAVVNQAITGELGFRDYLYLME